MLRREYSVVVDHSHAPELRGQHRFQTFQNNDGTWFADAPRFGTGKDYDNSEKAVYGLVHDHAGTILGIKQVD